MQDISISNVDGDSYIIPRRDEDVVKADAVLLGATDGDEFTDVDVQLAFADGIEIPSSIVIFLDVTDGTVEFNGYEHENQVYDECLVFSADSEWQGRFENVPCIAGAEYEMYIQESTVGGMYTLEEGNRYTISSIDGSIAEGLSCIVNTKDGNYSITKIPELAYGETAVITTTAVAATAADEVVNNVMGKAYGADGSGSGNGASGSAVSEATIDIVEAGAAASEQGEEGGETETQTAQEVEELTETGATQDSSSTDNDSTASKAAAENVEGEVVDINDESADAELYDDEEWVDDVALVNEGVDDTTAVQTGEGHTAAIAMITGCAAAALALTVIARKKRELA